MRYIITLLFCWAIFYGSAQTTNTPLGSQYFAQIQIDNSNLTTVNQVVDALSTNPNVFIFRYDEITNGILFITNGMTSFDEATMITWFEGNDNIIDCFQIGIQGVDNHIAFGTHFCNQIN